jgi:hypothetical protein
LRIIQGVTTSVAVGINLRMGNPIIDDIAVGAPLNSVANGTSPAQTTNAPISKNTNKCTNYCC